MPQLIAQARQVLKRILRGGVSGVRFLDREATISGFLNRAGDDIFTVREPGSAVVTRSGVIRAGRSYLDVDYGPFSALHFRSLASLPGSRTLHCDRAVSLWSHHWCNYYHWLIDVAPKVSAAKRFFGPGFAAVKLVYPCPLASYELETLRLLGVFLEQVVNPHETGPVVAREIFVLPLPGWYKVSARIKLLREDLASPSPAERRIYVSRAGTRRVENEVELAGMLSRYGFEFIPDAPRPLAEQISLFGSASHIVAPHGAALSNVVWAKPTTKVLEISSATYAPDFFVNLAATIGLRLDRLSFGGGRNHWSYRTENVRADVKAVEQFIRESWRL